MSDGSKYVGLWKDDKIDGHGTLTLSDGSKYVGEWNNDKRHGHGTQTWSGGSKYEGLWKDDKINEQGTLIWPDGSKYEGLWKDDNPNGYGVIVWLDGSKYVGEFKGYHGQKKGIMITPGGVKHTGNLNFVAIIISVLKDSNGEQAGLLAGDIIEEYNGVPIVNGDGSSVAMANTTEVQDQVSVKVIRKGMKKSFVLNGGSIGIKTIGYPRFDIIGKVSSTE